MAIVVNTVLTASYHACYGDSVGHGEEDELVLVTAALSSTTEIQALYDSKIIDFESAIPAALHSLGASANEITDALVRRRKIEEALLESEAASEQNEAKNKATDAHAEKTSGEAKAVDDASVGGSPSAH